MHTWSVAEAQNMEQHDNAIIVIMDYNSTYILYMYMHL